MLYTRHMRWVLLAASVACSPASPVPDAGDASPPSDACFDFCMGNEPAMLDLSCMSAHVVDASATGFCGSFTCPVSTGGVPFVDCKMVLFSGTGVGACNVSVQFDDGSTYEATVNFSLALAGSCCAPSFAPSPPYLFVDAGCSADAATD
jgi:hypothetical protein